MAWVVLAVSEAFGEMWKSLQGRSLLIDFNYPAVVSAKFGFRKNTLQGRSLLINSSYPIVFSVKMCKVCALFVWR